MIKLNNNKNIGNDVSPGSAGQSASIESKVDIIDNFSRIISGTSPNTGGVNASTCIELDSNASNIDGAYDPATINIIAGTGAGQSRQIFEYYGTTRIAYINRDWKVIPDNTSQYVILYNSGDTHVNEGHAQAGATSSITLNELASDQNQVYLGQMIFIVAGTGADQARLCIGYNGTTKILTVDSPWIIQPDETSVYAMFPFPGFVHGAPSADSTANILIRDVIGNKNDTTAGNSIVALNKSIDGNVDILKESIGVMASLRADTAVLFVSPNGDDSDGSSWSKAYNTLQGALDAASTDGDDLTLIFVSPHTTEYDIDTTGDPTWTGNYIIKGSHRQWAKITNNHASATSIMKFTGKVELRDLNINLGTSVNGVIITKGGFRIDDCFFNGVDLTSTATAIHIDGATAVKNGKIRGCDIKGEATSTHMTGILLDNAECTDILDTRIGFCSSGLQQVGADSNLNRYKDSEFCTCAIGANIDEGSAMSFDGVLFYQNTLNVDDEVGGHIFSSIRGEFEISVEPENLTGVSVSAGDSDWGTDTEIRAAASATKPFKVISYTLQPSAEENTLIRFSADSGSSFFAEDIFSSKKNKAAGSGDATDFIFNAGTRISASAWSPNSGRTVDVWLNIQEI